MLVFDRIVEILDPGAGVEQHSSHSMLVGRPNSVAVWEDSLIACCKNKHIRQL